MDSGWQEELKNSIDGEVYFDENTLGMYATDASVYQIFPRAVVVPRHEQDVSKIHEFAAKYQLNLLPRGAGTSLAGQTVADAIVIDFSKYMNQIIEFNQKEKWIRVQPGLIHSELNDFLKPFGLLYGPDPATTSRANIGGVVANNSSGSRSIVFGKAIDHILEITMVSASGELLHFRELAPGELNDKLHQKNFEGQIYQTLHSIIDADSDLIREKFPKVMRRVSGYCLDEFLEQEQWNLSKLMCGSEGTLGTITEMKLNLVDLPKHRGVCPVHYHNRMEAIEQVRHLLQFEPSAIELLDHNVIGIAKENPSTKSKSKFIKDDPGAILIVEFFGDTQEEVFLKYQRLKEFLDLETYSYHAPYYPEGADYSDIWEVRKKGLGLLLSMRTPEKPVTVIEDACVPVEHLSDYIRDIVAKCDQLKTRVILYAHASVGVLHVRPVLDMRKAGDLEKFRELSSFSLQKVMHYKGSFSGEHGDGISRSYGIPIFFGEKIYQDFVKIKKAFDPENRMNPGKIVDPLEMDTNLRYGIAYTDQKVQTVYHYRKELGFDSLVHMCNGVGLCQRVTGGVMCPSYKASLDEKDSTRGRANVLRLTMSGQINEGELTNPELLKVLDLCVSCKSCKTECPSNVDMAKLKSEVLQMHHDRAGIGLRGYFIIWSDRFSKWLSGPFSGMVNQVLKTTLFRYCLQWFAKIDARRVLDPYARISLEKWYSKDFSPRAKGDEVILFADTYINYHQVEIGKAILKLLDKMDYRVVILNTGGSQRPLISNGFLRKAKIKATKVVEKLLSPQFEGKPVIVCEPSAYSALVEDIPDLLDSGEDSRKIAEKVISLEHFMADYTLRTERDDVFSSTEKHHVIHGHCHQKAMEEMEYLHQIFRSTSGTYQIMDAGCCGMAGAFGFEKEHYDFSKKIFDGDLGKKIDQFPDEQLILASGFSCRHQIDDLSNKKVKHWVEILDLNL
jgi:FAD/FMN-containing dehydrogenase/Fe-S oxidoreductase